MTDYGVLGNCKAPSSLPEIFSLSDVFPREQHKNHFSRLFVFLETILTNQSRVFELGIGSS